MNSTCFVRLCTNVLILLALNVSLATADITAALNQVLHQGNSVSPLYYYSPAIGVIGQIVQPAGGLQGQGIIDILYNNE